MNGEVIAPGYYPALENARYQRSRGVSKSRLDAVSKSPRNYWAKYVDPDRQPEVRTEALILGDAIHVVVLEPDSFASRFMSLPEDAPRRPTERQLTAKKPSQDTLDAVAYWRDFEGENEGKTLLTADQHATVTRCHNAFWKHPVSGLFADGEAEPAFYAVDPETGAPIKCKIDWWRPQRRMIVDLKSARKADPEGFGRAAEYERYHVQPYWYPHVLEQHYGQPAVDTFVFVAIDKDAPNPIGVYYATPEDIEDGFTDARADLDTLLRCERTGIWPDYAMAEDGSLKAMPLERPYWAKRRRRFSK